MAEPTLNADVAKGVPGKETYGQILAQAREAKGLSVDQVASQLRLAPKQIVGLEASDPAVFGSTVYTRAHVRSYARLLGVDEAKIMNVFNSSLPKDERDLQSFIRKTTQSLRPYQEETTKNGKMKGLGWLLFLIVLGAVCWLGWDHFKDNFDVDEIKAKVTSMVPMLGSSEDSKSKEASTTDATAVPTANEGAQLADPSATATTGEATTEGTATPTATTATATDGTQTADPAMATLGRTPEEKALEEKVMAEQQAQQQQEQQAAANQAAPQEAPRSNEPIQLTQGAAGNEVILNQPSGEATVKFSATEGECWFGIYDPPNSKNLTVSVTLRDNQAKEYTQKIPFKVNVGNHFRGKVELDGRPVELSQRARSGSVSFIVRAE